MLAVGWFIEKRVTLARAAELAQTAFALDSREAQLSAREAKVATADADMLAREAVLSKGKASLAEAQEQFAVAQVVLTQREALLNEKETKLDAQVSKNRQGLTNVHGTYHDCAAVSAAAHGCDLPQ